MKHNKELLQLEKEKRKIEEQINKIEKKEIDRIIIPRLKTLVNHCYVYKNNCYSLPAEPNDYWSTYRRILDWIENKNKEFYFIIEEFFTDSNGRITWIIDNNYPYITKEWKDKKIPFLGFEEISKKEYNDKKAEMIKETLLQTKMRKILNTK